jgi:hypothetical protein
MTEGSAIFIVAGSTHPVEDEPTEVGAKVKVVDHARPESVPGITTGQRFNR